MTPEMLVASLLSPWGVFQLLALGAGLLVGGRRELMAFASGAAGAAFGALALPALLRLPQVLAGASFRLEVMSLGALAGFALGFAACARRRGAPWLGSLDRVAPALGAMVAVARLGCLAAGCDFGALSHAPWALSFPPASPAALQHERHGWISPGHPSLPVHPTQLYEVALGVLMLLAASRAPRRAGLRFAAVASTYAIGRFAIELYRGDEGRGYLGCLSMPQIAMCAVLGLCALIATRDEARDPSTEGRDETRDAANAATR